MEIFGQGNLIEHGVADCKINARQEVWTHKGAKTSGDKRTNVSY